MIVKIFDRNEECRAETEVFNFRHLHEINRLDVLTGYTLEPIDKGEKILYQHRTGKWYEFLIDSPEIIHEEGTQYHFTAINSLVEIDGDWIEDKRPSTLSAAVVSILEPTRWTMGNVANKPDIGLTFYRVTAREALDILLESYPVEFQTRIEVGTSGVVTRTLDVLDKIGGDYGKRFVFNRDLTSVKRTYRQGKVVTALYGFGKGEEVGDGFGRRIDFSSVNNGYPYVYNPAILAEYGRLENGVRKHVFDSVVYDDVDDKIKLLQLTQDEYAKRCRPQVSYEGTVVDLGLEHEQVGIGDTVKVIDGDHRFETRVNYLMENEDFQNEIRLANYIMNITDSNKSLIKKVGELATNAGVWDEAQKIVDGSYMDGLVDKLNDQANASGGWTFIKEGEGILTINAPTEATATKAVNIVGGTVRVASQKNSNGSWKWRTFITGDQVAADMISTGILKGGMVHWNLDTGVLYIGATPETASLYWDGSNLKLNVTSLQINSKDVATEESVSGAIDSATSPLITRISDAEQKITSDAIVSTVRSSTQYATDQSAKENTIYKSTTAPPSPTLNKLWLDLSVVPNVIRRWTGTEWIKTSPTTAQDIAYSPSNPASLESVVTGAVSRLEQADTDITAMFEQIQEGARNLLDGSTRLWSNANFKHSEYPLAENIEVGEIVSIALKGYLGAGRTSFALYNTYSDSYITSLTSLDYKDGIYAASFPWVGTENTSLVIYQQPEAGATISRIEWATLVRGDTPVRRQIKTQSELYTGIVRLFKDGITVGRSDTEVQTWLAYDGLRILTGLNSVPLAEFTLDGAETSRLYAGRAYAENMANCFRGTADVYVGASPTGDGSGKDELNLSDGVMTALNYALDGARSLESSAVINVRIQGVKKNEAVLIRGISGDGTINLIGAYGSTQIAGNIQIRNCTCRINLNGITLVNVDTNQAFGLIHVSGLCNVSIDSCRLDGGNVKNGVTAISGAKVRVTGTSTVNCLSAYYADDLSEIFAYDNFGQGNVNVAHSRMGSRIFLYDRRPNGTNPVLTATGGTVDNQGVGTGSSFSYTPPAFTNSTKTFYPLKAGTYYSGESFVFATEWRQGRATNGKIVIGFAEFGSQIKDWLESAGGYQGTPTIQIYADRNLSSGGGSVSMKIGTPSAMTLPAVVRGGKTSGTAPGALASSMVASSNLTLKSNTTLSADYGGFKIRVVVTAQKKV